MNTTSSLSRDLVKAAIKLETSDIHFYPSRQETNIYFRIHGKRTFHRAISHSQYQSLLTYYKFTSGMDIGETRKPQNGAYHFRDNHHLFSLRLSTLPINHMESLAIRILPQTEKLTLHNLFLFPYQVNKLKKLISNQSGIILFTGPTGSGKTTALYALIETILKENSYQTITLEDPIEKDIHDILQVQINEKAGITYQTGLKAALRHDPDMIMIGEIRDKYTAQFAFEAALTGHLVFSTLHAKNATGTIHRLLEMGIKQVDLLQSLIAVASIQLLPIERGNLVTRRAAILEILEGEVLEKAVKGGEIYDTYQFDTFEKIRKKAFAYGFITEEIYTT
ncbi:competence type IV pilus ATPase ComGA [Oceanobacillus bengalensis]|uniref:Competence protein n=1 Tax=Oceanobacillus bengalensis TaxID=1435466 RepID=A0A494Z0R1_9BACI|nr:competence type IV pilus ATPase ComGA [Oceanobacillus bengalensis]RKQ16023.1 competence protein [Oceanobacillus bengalensis]